jgi:hypothetical protein
MIVQGTTTTDLFALQVQWLAVSNGVVYVVYSWQVKGKQYFISFTKALLSIHGMNLSDEDWQLDCIVSLFICKLCSHNCGYETFFFFFLVASTLGSLLPLLEHRAEFPQFLDQGQSVGLLGRVISSSQGFYLYTNTQKRARTHTQTPNVHVLSGIRTHDPGFRVNEDGMA